MLLLANFTEINTLPTHLWHTDFYIRSSNKISLDELSINTLQPKLLTKGKINIKCFG